jgi:hypothetical protein
VEEVDDSIAVRRRWKMWNQRRARPADLVEADGLRSAGIVERTEARHLLLVGS